jgi:hypothetical protein
MFDWRIAAQLGRQPVDDHHFLPVELSGRQLLVDPRRRLAAGQRRPPRRRAIVKALSMMN